MFCKMTGMENEMLADYLQRDAERTSGMEDTDEVPASISYMTSAYVSTRKKQIHSVARHCPTSRLLL